MNPHLKAVDFDGENEAPVLQIEEVLFFNTSLSVHLYDFPSIQECYYPTTREGHLFPLEQKSPAQNSESYGVPNTEKIVNRGKGG